MPLKGLVLVLLLKAVNSAGETVVSDSSCSDSESSCLLSFQSRHLQNVSQLHDFGESVAVARVDDYMKRWAEAWRDQIPMNMAKEFIALGVKMAIGGFAGDVCGALIKALWPPNVKKEQRMMEIIMEWTKNYVDAQFEIELRSHVSALIETGTKDMLDMYHLCIEKVKEEAKRAWFFPKANFIACLGHLTNAIEPTTQALYEVANSKWKGGNVPTFLMAATVVMSLWREYYAAMVFQENWKKWPGAEPPKNASEAMNVTYTYTSKEIIQRMEAKYAWIQDHAHLVAEAWRPWRFEKIRYSYKQLSENKWQDSIEVRDQLRSKAQYWKSERCCLMANPNYKKLQPRVQAMYEQNLVALELMPMIKPVATLHRLIPKRENEKPRRGKVFPSEIIVGTVSTWLTHSWTLHTDTVDRWSIADKRHPDRYGSITKIYSRAGQILDQLTIEYDPYREKVELPPGSTGGHDQGGKNLPWFTCGIEVSYSSQSGRGDRMVQLALLNVTNHSTSWEGTDIKHPTEDRRFSTGPSLCELYTLHSFKSRSDVRHTGDAIEIKFKWEPVE